MALIFVTGAPGSGKTAVSESLIARGCTVYDTDDPQRTRMAGWHSLATGEYVAGFNEVPLSAELLRTHIWRLTDRALEDFQDRAENEQIYLCGRLRDAQRVIEVSRHVMFLTVSSDTIRERLEKRARIPGEVEWGREAWQVERSVEVNRQIETEYRALSAIMINADQPLPLVTDAIVDLSQS